MAGRFLAAVVLGALLIVAPAPASPAHADTDRGTTNPRGSAEGAQDEAARKSNLKPESAGAGKAESSASERPDNPSGTQAKADKPKADNRKPERAGGDKPGGELPAPGPTRPEPPNAEPGADPSPAPPPTAAQPTPPRPAPQRPEPPRPTPQQPAPKPALPEPPAPEEPTQGHPAHERPAPGRPAAGRPTPVSDLPSPQADRPEAGDVAGVLRSSQPAIRETTAFWDVRVGPPLELADPGSVPPSRAMAGPNAGSGDAATGSAAAAPAPVMGGGSAAVTLGVLFGALALGGVILSLRGDLRRPRPLP